LAPQAGGSRGFLCCASRSASSGSVSANRSRASKFTRAMPRRDSVASSACSWVPPCVLGQEVLAAR
jgi:hypothetical protein